MTRLLNRLRVLIWLALSLSGLVSPSSWALTATASPTSCVTVAGIGTVNWTNPARAVSSNNSYATAAVDGTTTRYLRCTGYNFSIPAGATINGITVHVERRSNRTSNGGSRDAAMRLVKAGVIGTADRATSTTYTTADVVEAHGGATDLWGDTWTPAEINAANFGAAFAAVKADAAGPAHAISVDHIQITVDYSVGSGTFSQTASPTSCVTVAGIGTVNWTNPARAVSSNNSYATAAVDGTTTRYLRCTGYNFSIPAGATINGITVHVERRSNRTSNGGSRDAAMRLVKAGVIGTVDRATSTTYTTADVVEAHGGATDLWGDTWTPAEINAANFGAAFAATKPQSNGPAHTISVDHIQVTVNFTIPAPLDHIRIEHAGAGVTCSPSTMTIKACANATCTSLSTASTSVTLSPAAAWSANPVTFTGSTTVSLSVTVPSTVILGTSAVTPAPSGASPQCYVGMTANCNHAFADTGFLFSVIPTQTAGVSSGALTIQAVRKADNAATCVGVFTGNVAIEMASQCVNPTTCAGRQLTINSTPIANHPAAGIGSYTPVSLNFGANSTATYTLNYPDVGLMNLTARYALGGGNFMSGTSNAFVGKPFGFTVTNLQRTADGFANPGAGSTAGPVFIKAGEDFSATVMAITQSGASAPNFGREIVPEGVLLTSNIVLPAVGNNPAISNGTIAGGAFAAGVTAATNLAWGEVGIITLTPSVADGDYLGVGNVTGTATGNVGRFTPHRFVASGNLMPGCTSATSYTYMGEPMALALTLTAQNASSGTTLNYTTASGFAKLDGATAAKWAAFGSNDSIGLGAVDGTTALSSRMGISGTPTGNWAAGIGSLNANVVLNRAASPDGPFENLRLGIAPQDADAVQLLPGALNLDADLNTANERQQVPASTAKVRYGRIRLNNAHGSELLALPVPVRAQYFNGSGFVTNGDDNCTAFTLAPTVNSIPVSYQYGDLLLNNPQPAAMLAAVTGTAPTLASPLSSGLSSIVLAKPSPATSGSVDLTLTVPAWLQYNWTGVVGNPKARATFGAYRNVDQFIYQRENY